MKTPICHLVGAGGFCPPLFSPQEKDLVIACDGGLLHLLRNGYTPHLAVGDFDSFSGDPAALLPEEQIVRLPKEKDDTDCLYALKLGLLKGYKRFLLHGSLGGDRFSHSLANVGLLSYLEREGASGTLVGQDALVFRLGKGRLLFEEGVTGYLSLFPIGNEARIVLEGLKYPFSGTLYDHTPIGVSNEFTENKAEITVTDGALLLVVEGQADPLLFFDAAERGKLPRAVENEA